jgi:hypothetical protein
MSPPKKMPRVLESYHEEDASDDGTKPDGPTQQDEEAQPAANQDHQTASGTQEGQTSTEQCQPMSAPKKVPTVLESYHEEDASDDGTKPDGPTQQDEEAQPGADQEHQTASGTQKRGKRALNNVSQCLLQRKCQ